MAITYEQMVARNQRQALNRLRALLRRDYGARKYRITRDDRVDLYGQMPNTNVTGWYFAGWIEDVAAKYTLRV